MPVTVVTFFAGIGLLIFAIILIVDFAKSSNSYDRATLTDAVILGAVFTGGGAAIGAVVQWLLY